MKKTAWKIMLLLVINHSSIEKGYSQLSPNSPLIQNPPDTTVNDNPASVTWSSGHPYRINIWVRGAISVAGTVGNLLAVPRILNKEKITDAELAALNPGILTGFDRWALKQKSAKRVDYDKLSDKLMAGIVLLPFTLAFDDNIRGDGWKLLLMYYETHAITFSIFNYTFLGPTFQDKFRPMAYYTDIPVEDRSNGNNRNSFFAGHVSSATSASFFMTKVYCDYHPELGAKKYLLYGAASVPALTMGYIRVLALKHFPSDVLVGMSVGAICGIIVPELHKRKYKNVKLGMFATPQGATGLCLNWNLPR